MNLISKLLPPSNILLDLEVASKRRVFDQAGLLFENNQSIARSQVFDSLFTRERLGSTGLGMGIAIPHGRIKGLRDAIGGYIRLKDAVAWDAPDGRPVTHVFVLLVPEQATELHLQILAELATMFTEKSFREKLTAASGAADVHSLFVKWDPNASGSGR
ncbi:MAG: PTS sugar transporter subunit IIA [Rhodocyclaceae bacterium]|nr:PTS sugar transporter subunit IIA [Rhodocyclaceae bacterium]MBX3668733.1 PTS sugar transporter subunit IIA [Rhodocyclaceae bacterium]